MIAADTGWLISVFGLAIGLMSLWRLSRARTAWQSEVAILRREVEQCVASSGTEVAGMRQSLSGLELGMVTAQELLREGRLNMSVRGQAMQLFRSGAAPETVASSLGMALSEARLLARVGQILSVRTESAPRA